MEGWRPNKKSTLLARGLVLALLTTLVASCLSEDQRLTNRPTVANFGTTNTDTTTPDPTPSVAAPAPVTRPTGQVFINKDYCACLEKAPDIINNCSNFCSGKSTKNPTLFASATLGPEVELNATLGNLFNWCKKEIGDGRTNPNCQLEVWDGTDKTFLDVVIPSGSNSFTADLTLLEKNKTYVMTLVETGSGSQARSNSFQVRRMDFVTGDPVVGPLRVTPVNEYFCVNRTFIPEDNANGPQTELYQKAVKRHFYFSAANSPPTLPPGDNTIFCHDINRFGLEDSPLFPRLGLTEQIYNVWNETDIRFFDQDANNVLDVNDLITKKVNGTSGSKTTFNIFFKFPYPNFPSKAGDTTPTLGYLMQPWIDNVTLRAYCLKQVNYNSDVPVFRILKDLVGVDTEGLYFGEKQPESFTDSNGNVQAAPTDFIIIREGLLKKIWFYYENGLHVVPDEVTSATRTVMVYWPPDVQNPHVKKSTQQIYIIKHPSQISNTDVNNASLRTGVTPPDKRFACAPSRD